jgi:hypothetical protein
MFEGIRHTYTGGGMTGASFTDGEVIGSVSFNAEPDRARVISSIGPDSAVRECVASYYPSEFRNRYKARTSEEVCDYS